MSSGFAALLKTSQDQTARSEREIDSQIAARRLQLEQKRKDQEAKERKEREIEAKLRAKHMEDLKREEERKRKRAEEEEVRKKEQARREEQMRDQMRYGPKKAASVHRSKASAAPRNDSGDDVSGGPALTREEKRQRRLDAQLRRTSGSTAGRRGHNSARNLTALPDGRTVRRLPGGAVDVTIVSRLTEPKSESKPQLDNSGNKSTRERLAAEPAVLLKLNTVKRDTRTLDDLVTEREKNKQKVLAGEDAKNFSNWFGKKKKEEDSPPAKSIPQSSSQQSNVPSRRPSTTPSRAASGTPPLSPAGAGPGLKRKLSTSFSSSKPLPSFTKASVAKASPPVTIPRQVPNARQVKPKRPASPSLSPPPAKRRVLPSSSSTKPIARFSASRPSTYRKDMEYDDQSEDDSDKKQMAGVSEVIHNLFRRGRAPLNEISDDYDTDDMEAGVDELVKEERMSSRFAKKEDAEALSQQLERERQKKLKKMAKLNRKA